MTAAPALAASYGAPENVPARVVVTATDASWVRVRDADGKSWTRTLEAGDSYRVPDHAAVTLDTGNIKALKVSLDGTEKPFAGTVGHSIVQHDLPLGADRLAGETPRQQVADAAPPKRQSSPQPITPTPATAVPAPVTPPQAAAPAPAASAVPAVAAPAPVVVAQAAPTPAASTPAAPPAPVPVVAAPAPVAPIAAAPAPAPAQTPRARPTRAEAPQKAEASQVETDQKGLEIEIGKGTVIQLRHAASTVFISNPAIADVQVKSPTLIYVMAKAPGETSLFASDASDHILLQSPIRVILNLSRLRTTLSQLLPGEPIKVDSIEGAIVLTGTVSSPAHSADAQAIAGLFANQQAQQQSQQSTTATPNGTMQFNVQTSMIPTGGSSQGSGSQGGGQGSQSAPATPPTVINRLAVIAPNQVNLRVRVAEVARNTLRELGINWNHTPGAGGNYLFSTDNPVLLPNNVNENLLRIGLFGPAANPISAQIDAMAQEGLITTLAEPNLSAMSGQTASFLAGGEFPVPVATATSNGAPTVTIEFKKYGVAIDFVPTILDSRRVNLRIRSEVSQLTQQGAIQSLGITIPAIQVRRAETSVELGSGDSFAIAGLLQNNGEHDISKIPALGDLPVLGPLFRSDRYQRQETELVILVTPYLVQPSAMAGASPIDGLVRPNDVTREVTGAPYIQSPAGSGGRGTEQVLVGPAGFQLN